MKNLITHKKLINYNLFSNDNNVTIDKALFVWSNKIDIYLKHNVNEIQLNFYYYNYDSYNTQDHSNLTEFEVSAQKIMVNLLRFAPKSPKGVLTAATKKSPLGDLGAKTL